MLSCRYPIRPVTGNLVVRGLAAKGVETPRYGQLERRLLLTGIVMSPHARELLAERHSIQQSPFLLSHSLRQPRLCVVDPPHLHKLWIGPDLSFVNS
jgi:hypothetical protein